MVVVVVVAAHGQAATAQGHAAQGETWQPAWHGQDGMVVVVDTGAGMETLVLSMGSSCIMTSSCMSMVLKKNFQDGNEL